MCGQEKMSFFTVRFKNNKVILLDQRLLPEKERYLELRTYQEVAKAIEEMAVRGAPLIGICAGFGLALAGLALRKIKDPEKWWKEFEKAFARLAGTRPTAVNLFWAIARMKKKASSLLGISAQQRAIELIKEAEAILKQDLIVNHKIGEYGASLIEDGDLVLTHCNAGALATGGYGTALGVIRSAIAQGKKIKVLSDETRPVCQGARLTCWELTKDKIPVRLICDDMAGWAIKNLGVKKILVGADRIARNGDTANKIGTYSLAVLAKHHKIPFYVCAPLSTIDLSCPSGDKIPVEERKKEEVIKFGGKKIAPKGIGVWNPAFDITPAYLISAIITEKGIVKKPNQAKIKALFR